MLSSRRRAPIAGPISPPRLDELESLRPSHFTDRDTIRPVAPTSAPRRTRRDALLGALVRGATRFGALRLRRDIACRSAWRQFPSLLPSGNQDSRLLMLPRLRHCSRPTQCSAVEKPPTASRVNAANCPEKFLWSDAERLDLDKSVWMHTAYMHGHTPGGARTPKQHVGRARQARGWPTASLRRMHIACRVQALFAQPSWLGDS